MAVKIGFLRRRRSRQPVGFAELDRGNPLTRGIADVWSGNSRAITARGVNTTLVGSATVYAAGAGGFGVSLTAVGGANSGLKVTDNADLLFGLGSANTIFVVRRCLDTTARNSLLFGYGNTPSGRILCHAPYSDGNMYFDFENATAGSGRISVAYTKDTDLETLVFVAGPNKGREIWRRGVKIASNTSATAARTSNTSGWGIGSPISSDGTDNFECYMIGVSGREWADVECISFCRNPWQIFRGDPVPYWQSFLTTFTQALTASVAIGASRVRTVQFVKSASAAWSASRVRVVKLVKSASSAMSATLAKSKAVNRSLTTTGTPSATFSRVVERVRSATSSLTATRVRVLQRIRSASSTMAATLSRIRALKRTITASVMTVSASMTRVRSLVRSMSASAALSASRSQVVKLIQSASAGTTASMTRVKVAMRTITASVSLAATRSRLIGRIRSATAGSSATVSRLRRLGKTITASVSGSASIRRSFGLILSGAQHITALVSRGTRGIIDITVGVTIQPTLSRIRALKRTVTATTTWAATVRKAVRMSRTAVVTVVATRVRRFPYHVTTAVTTVVARLQPARVRVLTATTTLVATITTTLAQIGRLFARIAIRPAVGALRSLKAAVGGKPRIDDDH